MRADTLVDVLRSHADARPERPAIGTVPDGDRGLETLTYGALDQQARRVADLLGASTAPGSRALLIHDSPLEFVAAFTGCLYAGVVPVPVVPPAPPRLDLGVSRLAQIRRDSGAGIVLTSQRFEALARSLPVVSGLLDDAAWLATDPPSAGDARAWRPPRIGGSTVALLQYTSGSTAAPKGVVVDHANLLANQEAIAWALQIPDGAVMVGWLPTYHDMGLIGTVLHPLYRGSSTYLMSPLQFLQRPARWLELVTRFEGYISGAPNFAYALCARRVRDEEKRGLDLSSWRIAFNGSEPIRPATVRAFQRTFAPCGFRPEALVGCYGMAEATLLASGAWSTDPKFLTVDRTDLEERGKVTILTPGRPGTVELATAGRIPPGHDVRVVDPQDGRPLPPGRVGELWLAGPSVAAGYWGRPEETAAVFGAVLEGSGRAYLRTGDVGFLLDGRLYVTGRLKELLIVHGRNVHPHDVEDAAERADGHVRPGGSAAYPLDGAGEERVGLVVEVEAVGPGDLDRVATAVRRQVFDEVGVAVEVVTFAPPRSVLKTSSGKVRRSATREALAAGRLPVLGESVRSPVSRRRVGR